MFTNRFRNLFFIKGTHICFLLSIVFVKLGWGYETNFNFFCLGGAAGAVSKVTGALGKGVASITMDDEYKRKRLEEKSKQPADLKEGLARGGKGLVMVKIIVFFYCGSLIAHEKYFLLHYVRFFVRTSGGCLT